MSDQDNMKDLDEAPTSAVPRQEDDKPQQPKTTIRLQPKASAEDEAATVAVPKPTAQAPKATIRLQPKSQAASLGAQDEVPTVSVPRPGAAAPKATIRLQPKTGPIAKMNPDEEPTVSVPRPGGGAAPKATIRLQPKTSDSGMLETVSTVPVKRPNRAAATAKIDPTGTQAAAQAATDKTASISKQTIRLVPKGNKGGGAKPSSPTVKLGGGAKPSSPTVKLGGGPKPSSPTVKLGGAGGAKPSSPTVKLGGAGGAKPSSPTVKLGGGSPQGGQGTTILGDDVSGVEITSAAQPVPGWMVLSSVASLLVFCGAAALIFMSYSEIWS